MSTPRHKLGSDRMRRLLMAGVGVAFILLSALTLLLYSQFHQLQRDSAAQAKRNTANIQALKDGNGKANAAVTDLAKSVTDLRSQVNRCSDLKPDAPGCTVPVAPPAVTTIRGATGASGAPGVGIPGLTGLPGADSSVPGPSGPAGTNGADSSVPGPPGSDGAPGAAGAPGQDGANGANGADGQPPFSWTYTDALLVEHTCTRNDPFDPSAPRYTCS